MRPALPCAFSGLRDFIASGDVVVATDYPGLGTPGPTPYLIGDSEGRAVLDSVRAAQLVPDSAATSRFVAWGHSQGGHAAIYAGLLARTYAPELELAGVALAAPATDLATLIREDLPTDGGRNLTAMTLWAWSQVFGASLQGIIDPGARPVVDQLAGECLESIADFLVRRHVAAPLKQRFLRVADITAVQPWSDILGANVPGPLPPSIPVFVAQGEADTLVRPEVTSTYVEGLCKAGSLVRSLMLPGVAHGWTAFASQAVAVGWIQHRFAGDAAPSDCLRSVAMP